MYTTQQQHTSSTYDENRIAQPKAALVKASSMANVRGSTVHSNNRRTLGDIGNLVGALSARCTVSKDGLQENPAVGVKQVTVVDRPRTRRFGASLANNELPPNPKPLAPPPSQPTAEVIKTEVNFENAVPWGAKQRRTMGPSKARECEDMGNEINMGSSSLGDETNAMPPATSSVSRRPAAQPSRLKALASRDTQVATVRKKQTLTATLTARSEAACGGSEVEMEEAVEPLHNIDGVIGDQLAVVDYAEDIYDFYRKTEIQSCVAPDYMCHPADFNEKMRAILIDWLVEAACGGSEVEMEEAVEPLPNIDEGYIGDQLAVVDYVEDIYDFYRKTEIQSCVAPDYMCHQADINEKMRAILIDWLIEVHLKFKLMPETLFLTTNLIDRYLACQGVLRENLQLVGVTAMLVASKYEEIFAPELQDFVFISDNAYTREQLLEMEKSMLNKLKFNLTVPTPYVFLIRFLKAATSNIEMEMLAFFLIELCLTEYAMVRYPPSLLAAAAVYSAQQTLKKSPCWNTILQHHTGYTAMQLRECASMMVSFHRKAGQGNLVVVHKKYSNSQFCSVAKLEPAVFQLEDSVNVIG